jgi:hypothetical protein
VAGGGQAAPDLRRVEAQKELKQPRVQLGHHASDLGAAVARVQRRQLDRDAGAVVNGVPGGGLAGGAYRLPVSRQVGLVVARGQRRLAQHVAGVAEALGLAAAGVGQR